ncbi:MAG: hypothetical protein NWF11_07195 [Candidatus Bathyarchaeota archaeon]|nr:hypothetical protein [Candidatus Bathyarchaeota archaeon]
MLEHFEGNKPAIMPKKQIKLKMVPTKGFRQAAPPVVVEVLATKTETMIRPRKEKMRNQLPRDLESIREAPIFP